MASISALAFLMSSFIDSIRLTKKDILCGWLVWLLWLVLFSVSELFTAGEDIRLIQGGGMYSLG